MSTDNEAYGNEESGSSMYELGHKVMKLYYKDKNKHLFQEQITHIISKCSLWKVKVQMGISYPEPDH